MAFAGLATGLGGDLRAPGVPNSKLIHLGYFNRCVTRGRPEDYEPFPGAHYPAALSLAEAMEWFWRIRKWRVKVRRIFNVILNEEDQPIGANAFEDIDDVAVRNLPEIGPPKDIEDELEIVCLGINYVFKADSGIEPQGNNIWGFSLFGSPFFDSLPGVLWDDSNPNDHKYYPRVYGNFAEVPDEVVSDPSFIIPKTYDPATGAINFDLSHLGPYPPQAAAPDPETGIMRYDYLEMRPIEWWPYDPKDGGGPIYDPENGDRLR